MTRWRLAFAAVLLLFGCVGPRVTPNPADAVDALAQAEALARDHHSGAARQLYRKVLREQRGTPAAEAALYGLARLYVDPESGVRDYSAAQAAFARLLSEYPDGARANEARAWQAALSELLRSQAEAGRLRRDLERLKQLDMEQEGAR